MIYASVPSFFGLGLEGSQALDFVVLLQTEAREFKDDHPTKQSSSDPPKTSQGQKDRGHESI